MTNKQIKVSSNVSGIKQQYIYRVKEIGGYFNAVTAQGAHIQKRACSSILMPYMAHTEATSIIRLHIFVPNTTDHWMLMRPLPMSILSHINTRPAHVPSV
jgi:hypothetical protein